MPKHAAGTTIKPSSRPYDRPSSASSSSAPKPQNYQLKVRGKKGVEGGLTGPTEKIGPFSAPSSSKFSLKSGGKDIILDTGAPAALGQTSRKGKKAWRKNIDIRDVEGALEEARQEERITGGKISERSNGALFTVDVTGDAALANSLARSRPKKPLRSLAILSERSAIPSPSARSTHAPSIPKIRQQEKARLRRIALREHRPEGQSASQIPIVSTTPKADAWITHATPKLPGGFGDEVIAPPKPKFPVTLEKRRRHLHDAIVEGRTVDLPEAGTSYNPTLESHALLMDKALEEERVKIAQETTDAARIAERGLVIENRRTHGRTGEFAEGMLVGPGEGDDAGEGEDEEDVEELLKRKEKGRKTQAQRNKAIRLRDLAEAEKRAKQAGKLAKSIGSLSLLKKAEQEREARHQQAAELRRSMKRDKEARGVMDGGEKVGKYVVKKGDVAVQLGEDLAETLRQVKPEGNQFKDTFLALQRKGLVEPRLPQARKQKAARTKEYEKHAYKRFV